MAEKFSLVAQIQLQAPTNTRQVVDRIRRDLSGVSVQLEAKGAAKTANEVAKVNKQLKNASASANTFASNLKIATQRAAGLAIATRAVSALTSRFKSAVDEAISFQRELVKVSQVTGKTLNQLKGLSKEITNLSTSLGVSSTSLISVSRQLSQAGFQAADLQVALSALAKTALAPTFDDITRTAEGAIAIFNQFGKGAAALEGQLGAINAVAGQFAVESGDLIGVVQRVGGVFKSAGGSLEELIALFTSVRATTRESSESIATGLRTIFTRIQRPRTIAFLKNLGVSLTDAEGRFIGPTKAVEALNKAFADLPQGDLRFVQIAEELGGFRQIGKVIPLIQQFAVAQEALKTAQAGQDSLAKDAATAQQALGVQIEKVRQEYLALIREFTESSSFKLVVGLALNFASALAKVLSSLKEVLPLLAIFGASRFISGGGLGSLVGGLRGGVRRNQGGPIGFARGGVVPGAGNRDTVPAMLTPGEFVIKKSSVGKIGAGTLAQMNENRFAQGGVIADISGKFGLSVPQGATGSLKDKEALVSSLDNIAQNSLRSQLGLKGSQLAPGKIGKTSRSEKNLLSRVVDKKGSTKIESSQFDAVSKATGVTKKELKQGAVPNVNNLRDRLRRSGNLIQGAFPQGAKLTASGGVLSSFSKDADDIFNSTMNEKIPRVFSDAVNSFPTPLGGLDKDVSLSTLLEPNIFESVKGSLFEAFVRRATGTEAGSSGGLIDFPDPKGLRKGFNQLFDPNAVFPNEFKNAVNASNIASTYGKAIKSGIKVDKRASGGGISGSDTVPALLTPGEFVINKKAAKRIGSANLNTMNKKGVVGFNKGGVVGFNKGGGVSGGAIGFGALALASGGLESIFGQMGAEGSALNDAFNALTGAITSGVVQYQLMNAIIGQNTEKTNANSAAKEKETQASQGPFPASNISDREAIVPQNITANLQKHSKDNGPSNVAAFLREQSGGDDYKTPVAPLKTRLRTAAERVSFGAQKLPGRVGQAATEALDKQFEKLANSKIYKVLTDTESISQKVNKRFGDLRKQVDFVGRSKKAYANTIERTKAAFKGLPGSASKAVKGLFGLKAAARSANRALKSVKGGVGGFAGKFKGLTAALPGLSAALGVATSAAGYFAEQANKRLEGSIEEGDIAGIRANAESAQFAQNTGSVLSGAGSGALAGAAIGSVIPVIGTAVGGFVGAAAGAAIAFFNTEDATKKTAEAMGKLSDQQLSKANNQLQNFSEGVAGAKGIEEFANSFGSTLKKSEDALNSSNKSTQEIQNQRKKNEQLRQQAASQIAAEAFAQGKSMAYVNEQLKKLAGSSGVVTEAQRKAAETAFRVAAAQKELIKVNLDAARIGGATARAGTAVDNILASFETGSSALEAAFNTLETSTSTFGGAESGQAALATISQNVNAQLDSLGIDKDSVGRQAVDRSIQSAGAAVDFSAQLSQRLSDPKITRGANAEAEIEGIVTDITSSIKDPKVTAIVQGSLKQVIAGAKLEGGQIDGSKVVESLTQSANKAGVPLKLLGEALIKQQKVINQVTNERRAQEQKLMVAQSKAIDLQLEGARIIEQAGGPQLSTRDQLGARAAQASLVLRDAGVAGLGGTDTSSIRAASRNIANRSAQLNQTRGLQNRDDDRRPELKKANDALVQFTRQRIKLIQEEMNIVKQKNALERSAIDALLSGDAEAFFEQQSASAAAAALKSGNTALIRSLDASAVGAGLKSLQKQGTSSTELFSAARTAGLSQQQAKIFSGTTEEETSLRRELIESGRTLGDLGNTGAELEAQGIQPILDKFSEVQKAFQEELVKGLQDTNKDALVSQQKNTEAIQNQTDAVVTLTKVIAEKPENLNGTININNAGGNGLTVDQVLTAFTSFFNNGKIKISHGQDGSHKVEATT